MCPVMTLRLFCPARFPDLSMCDYFLWGYFQSKVYIRSPHAIADLKFAIRSDIVAIPPKMLVRAAPRFQDYVRNGGIHLLDIIFKMKNNNVIAIMAIIIVIVFFYY